MATSIAGFMIPFASCDFRYVCGVPPGSVLLPSNVVNDTPPRHAAGTLPALGQRRPRHHDPYEHCVILSTPAERLPHEEEAQRASRPRQQRHINQRHSIKRRK